MTLDIIYLCSNEKWWDWELHGFVSRPACVAHALANHPDVRQLLVVNNPSSIWRSVEMRLHGERGRSGLTPVREGLHVLDHVGLLPRERSNPVFFRTNRLLEGDSVRQSVMRACDGLAMRDPVVWLTGPYVARCAEWFPRSPVVYDAMDEWLANEALASMRPLIREGYEAILKRADIVFAASDALARTFAPAVSVVRHVPNGVDPTRFTHASREPERLAGVPHPRAGYVGTLQDRVDVQLAGDLATLMPDVHFVFVGPVLDQRHFAPLTRHANVHLVGACESSQVPDYLASFDICIMPHVLSEFTRNMDPLKLYEYIAADRLVVASDLPGLQQPRELVRYARTADDFALALRDAIEGRWTMDKALRESYLEHATWTCRVDEMIETVSKTSQGNGRRPQAQSETEEEGT